MRAWRARTVLGALFVLGLDAPAQAADPPGLFNGFTILDTFKEEGMHSWGEPEEFIDVRKPLRLKLAGVGKCKVTVSVLDKDAKDVLDSETYAVTLPTTFSVPMAIPNWGGKNTHYGYYTVRAVRVAPVVGSGNACAGASFTTKVSAKGSPTFSILSPLKPLTTRTLRIAYDTQEDNNTLKFRVSPGNEGTHAPCTMLGSIQGNGFSKSFKVPAIKFGDLNELPNVDKELEGIKSGNYTFMLRAEGEDATCRGHTVGTLAVEVSKPGLKRVVPKQFHFESGKLQSLTIEGSFPAQKNVKCDLEVRLFTRGVDEKGPPRVQTVKLEKALLPVTLNSGVMKGDGGQFATIVGDTLTHVVVKAGGICDGQVTTDFGVMTVPKSGVSVVSDLPTIKGLYPQLSKAAKIAYTVDPPPAYAKEGVSCCQVETYRLDETNAWVKFKTLSGAATLEDLRTAYVTDDKPTLVRLRGYRNGVFTYWSIPVVIDWL